MCTIKEDVKKLLAASWMSGDLSLDEQELNAEEVIRLLQEFLFVKNGNESEGKSIKLCDAVAKSFGPHGELNAKKFGEALRGIGIASIEDVKHPQFYKEELQITVGKRIVHPFLRIDKGEEIGKFKSSQVRRYPFTRVDWYYEIIRTMNAQAIRNEKKASVCVVYINDFEIVKKNEILCAEFHFRPEPILYETDIWNDKGECADTITKCKAIRAKLFLSYFTPFRKIQRYGTQYNCDHETVRVLIGLQHYIIYKFAEQLSLAMPPGVESNCGYLFDGGEIQNGYREVVFGRDDYEQRNNTFRGRLWDFFRTMQELHEQKDGNETSPPIPFLMEHTRSSPCAFNHLLYEEKEHEEKVDVACSIPLKLNFRNSSRKSLIIEAPAPCRPKGKSHVGDIATYLQEAYKIIPSIIDSPKFSGEHIKNIEEFERRLKCFFKTVYSQQTFPDSPILIRPCACRGAIDYPEITVISDKDFDIPSDPSDRSDPWGKLLRETIGIFFNLYSGHYFKDDSIFRAECWKLPSIKKGRDGAIYSIISYAKPCPSNITFADLDLYDLSGYLRIFFESIFNNIQTWDVKREREKASIRGAISAIMSRNMSHNIGSHILVRLAQESLRGDVEYGRDAIEQDDRDKRVIPFDPIQLVIEDAREALREASESSTESPLATNEFQRRRIGAAIHYLEAVHDQVDPNVRLGTPKQEAFVRDTRVLATYLQQRMDFIAQICTDWPQWTITSCLVHDVMALFFRQSKLLEHIAASENLTASRFGNDRRLLDKPKEKNKNGETTNKDAAGRIKFIIRHKVKTNKMSEPFTTILDFKDTGENPICNQDHNIPVSFPGGRNGWQAFFVIIEGMIRNAAKHSYAEYVNEINREDAKNEHPDLIIVIDVIDNEEKISVKAPGQNETTHKPAYTVRIYSNVSINRTIGGGLNGSQKYKSDDLQERLDKLFVEEGSGQLNKENWGLSEIRAAVGYLQQAEIMDISRNEREIGDQDGKISEKKIVQVNSYCQPDVPLYNFQDSVSIPRYYYEFKLLKPQIIGVETGLPVKVNGAEV